MDNNQFKFESLRQKMLNSSFLPWLWQTMKKNMMIDTDCDTTAKVVESRATILFSLLPFPDFTSYLSAELPLLKGCYSLLHLFLFLDSDNFMMYSYNLFS